MMGRLIKQAFLLAAVSCLMILCACTDKSLTWQEQYDLGVRYLSEGNYEEAVIAFTAAIEIDNKLVDAYIGAADAYIGQGDLISAKEVLNIAAEQLEDERIKEKIESLAALETSMQITPGSVVRTEKEIWNDGAYALYEYDADGREVRVSAYHADDTLIYIQENHFAYDGRISGGIRTFPDQNYIYEYDLDENGRTVLERYGPSEEHDEREISYLYQDAIVEVTLTLNDEENGMGGPFVGKYTMSEAQNRIRIESEQSSYDEEGRLSYIEYLVEEDHAGQVVAKSNITLSQ